MLTYKAPGCFPTWILAETGQGTGRLLPSLKLNHVPPGLMFSLSLPGPQASEALVTFKTDSEPLPAPPSRTDLWHPGT